MAATGRRPTWLRAMLLLCGCLSLAIASMHFAAIRSGCLGTSPWIRGAPGGLRHVLREVWFTKLLREAVSFPLKTRLRFEVVDLVDCELPAGSVIAICPTPWSRLLAEWCAVRNFGFVFARGASWRRRTGNLAMSEGFAALRELVRHLRTGGRVVIFALSPARSHPVQVRFLGSEQSVSSLPARLAVAARVPLVSAVADFQDGCVRVRPVLTDAWPCRGTEVAAMKAMLARLEEEIRQRPAIWSRIPAG